MKLFLITSGLFIVTFLLFFLGQSLFLERFYINKKINNVQNAFETFVTSYEKSNQSPDALRKLQQIFYERTNAQIVLLDRNGVVRDKSYYDMVVQDATTGQTFQIPLNNVLTADAYSAFMRLQAEAGADVLVQGIRKGTMVIPIFIQTNTNTWTNESVVDSLRFFGIKLADLGSLPSSQSLLVTVRGTITQLHLPTKTDVQFANNVDMLIQGIQHWELSVRFGESDPSELTTYLMEDDNGVKNQIFVKPIMHNGQATEFAFAMTSLQPVNEAMGVLKSYYLYALLIAFAVIILLSFYYSKIISKPLLEMSEVTRKMAGFDFSEKLAATSNDEIGSLSESINTLSVNLKDRIDKLRVANEKLKQDVERERQLERTRKEFISGVSHELKTPLSVIRSFAEGIQDGVGQNTDYYTEVILEEVEKIDTLIVDMLELAKLESGTYKLDMTAFPIGALLRQVYSRLLFGAEEKELQVQLEIDDSLLVEANRNRVDQVIVNLLSNAIRYAPAGQQLIVSAAADGHLVKISIWNSGEPIPLESLDKIWDRFYRIDASRSRHTGGTGLGLSIVKNILELHGAPYGVENKNGGVEFYFFLRQAEI
nr:HAMP domain-containing sensor histidine kinase [Ectobacillus ponti]